MGMFSDADKRKLWKCLEDNFAGGIDNQAKMKQAIKMCSAACDRGVTMAQIVHACGVLGITMSLSESTGVAKVWERLTYLERELEDLKARLGE